MRSSNIPAIYHHQHTVTPAEIDLLGHVNNLDYIRWMLAAAVAHSDAQGWTTAAHLQAGCGWVVRSHQIEYLSPAFVGEKIVVRTWVAEMKKVTSLRRYEIRRESDDALLAAAATSWAFIDFASGVPKRIPTEVAEAFEVVSPDGDGGGG